MAELNPCLWCDGNAEEMVDWYVANLPKAEKTAVWQTKNEDGSAGPVVMVAFEVLGSRVLALNGGPQYKYNPAISLSLDCESQEQADLVYSTLLAEGEAMACGWVTDRFGVSWQVVPPGVLELLFSDNAAASARAMAEMQTQLRLDEPAIRRAYEGR